MGSRGWDVQVRTHATGLDDQFERGQRTNHCGVDAGALTVQHHDLRVAYARNQISLIRGLVVLDLDFDSLSQPLKTGYPGKKWFQSSSTTTFICFTSAVCTSAITPLAKEKAQVLRDKTCAFGRILSSRRGKAASSPWCVASTIPSSGVIRPVRPE